MNERNGMSQTFIERTQSHAEQAKLPDYQSNIDEVLTPDEVMEISGYQPEQAELIDREFMLQRDGEPAEQRDSSENPLVRLAIATLLVGGVLGLGWMIWSLFFASKPKATPVGSSTPKPTPTKAFESDEASRLKAELALRNQASRTQQQQKLPQPKSAPSPTAIALSKCSIFLTCHQCLLVITFQTNVNITTAPRTSPALYFYLFPA